MMTEYEKLSDEELNWQIVERKHGAQAWQEIPNYLNDDGATWRALVEMPVRELKSPLVTWNDTWRCVVDHVYEVVAPTAARAVWIAWLDWQDSKGAK